MRGGKIMIGHLYHSNVFLYNILFLTSIIFAVIVLIITFLISRHNCVILAILKALIIAILSGIAVFIILRIVFFIIQLYAIVIIAFIAVIGAFCGILDN